MRMYIKPLAMDIPMASETTGGWGGWVWTGPHTCGGLQACVSVLAGHCPGPRPGGLGQPPLDHTIAPVLR